MNDHHTKKGFRAAACIFAVCGCFIFILGCGNQPVQLVTRGLTSYVSTDSTVYSNTSSVVRKVADSVVEIRTESVTTQWGMQYVVSGAGSGVIVGHDNDFTTYFIVTNNHVVAGAREIEVTLRSGEKYDATLVATDEQGDIAVLAIAETCTLNVAVWGNSDEMLVGDDLIAIGNPLGSLGGTVTKGIVSCTARTIPVNDYSMRLIQTDTAINPGNSGGGLFNMRGELVGVVNAKKSDEEIEGICFAIPSNVAKKLVEELLAHGYVTGRASLGIEVAASSNVVYVTESSAPANTFRRYDRIYEINGTKITSMLGYHDAIDAIAPGDIVSVKVYRGSLVQQPFTGSTIVFEDTPTTFTITAVQKGA